ncbi:MAG: hypothetical protein RML95_06215 [Anaerolineae bacterium]|nr:hypothetical protein [Anaerolineae bacterium]
MAQRFLAQTLIGMTCLAIMLVTAGFIARYSVNVPHWDEWQASAPVVLKTAQGTLTLADLLKPHDQPRIFFTHLTTALVTALAAWDVRVQMWVSFALAILSFGVFLAIQQRTHPSSALWLAVPFALLIFAVRQRQNWLMGFQTAWFFWLFFTVLALWLLVRLPVRTVSLVPIIVCTVGASYAYLSGLALAFAMLPALWLRGYRKPIHYGVWLGSAAVYVGLYFTNYAFIDQGFRTDVTAQLWHYPLYVLRYLGAPFVPDEPDYQAHATVFGVFGVALAVINLSYLRYKLPTVNLAVPLVLILMSVANGALASIGRVKPDLLEYFWARPTVSRYVTAANLFWIALLMLGAMALWQAGRERRLIAIANIAMFSAAALGYVYANLTTPTYIATPEDRLCVLNYMRAPHDNCLFRVNADRSGYLATAQQLGAYRLTSFYDWYLDFEPAAQPAEAHLQFLSGIADPPVFKEQPPDQYVPERAVVLYQHPPSIAEQYLQLPQAEQVHFEAEIYVDLRNIFEHPEVLQTGALFRLGIREGRSVKTLYEGVFDVRTDRAPIPMRADLSAWRGQRVILVYQTEVREGIPFYAWAMWRKPRIVASP